MELEVMRAARRDDIRRHLERRQVDLRLVDCTAPGLFAGALVFHGAITAVCGGNGTGKTRMLRALAICLNCTTEAPRSLRGLTLTLRYQRAAVDHECSCQIDEGGVITLRGDRPTSVFVSPAAIAHRIQDYFGRLEPELEEYPRGKLDAAQLSELSFLVNRAYESVEVVEIDDMVGQFGDAIPFFYVRAEGREYTSPEMGLGELSLFVMWWALQRAEAGCLVLLDEPDAHVSPHSQESLHDVIIHAAMDRQLTVVMSTHSEAVVGALNQVHHRLLVPASPLPEIQNRPRIQNLLASIGAQVRKSAIILVEDSVSSAVVTWVVGRFSAHLFRVADIVIAGSDGEVLAALRFPTQDSWVRILGVLDGDVPIQPDARRRWSALSLPGPQRPEQHLRARIVAEPAKTAQLINRSPDVVRTTLAQLVGADDHDFLIQFADAVAMHPQQFVDSVMPLWFEAERATFEALAAEIERILLS